MDFLLPAFHEELKDESRCYVKEGRVFIGGKYWEPGDILKQISVETHKEIFDQWIEERKESYIQIADDFLDEFEQEDRFHRLKDCFTKKSVIPFVGAGLSQSSGYKLWSHFLETLRRQTAITEDQLNTRMSRGEYEEAAQDLANVLGPAFDEALERTYGGKKDLKGVVQFLPSLFDGPIITTNYDSVLKRAYDQVSNPFEEIISGHSATELGRYFGANDRVLVKLHGTAMSSNGRILTQQEYAHHYEHNNVIEEVISIICSKTLLFLGCSLSVDRTILALKKYAISRNYKNSRHYAFLAAPASQELVIKRSAMLAESNIYPIWYSGGDHDQAIEAFLHKLGE